MKERTLNLAVALIFVSIPIITLLLKIYYQIDFIFLFDISRGLIKDNGIYQLFKYFFREYRNTLSGSYEIFSLFIGSYLALEVSKCKSEFRSRLIYYLSLFLSLFFIFSLAVYPYEFSKTICSNWFFWKSVHRYCGLASDPNCLGILAFLGQLIIIHAVINKLGNKSILLLGLFSCIGCGLLSGSRSWALGTLLLFISSIKKTKQIIFALLVLSVLVFSLVILSFFPHVNSIFPETLTRVILSLNPSTIFSQLSSRYIFWKIDLLMFISNPIFGIGYHNFNNELLKYSQLLNINLNGWKDNPNSYYLGLLAEQGICGLLVQTIIFRLFGISNEKPILASGIIIFLFLLLFGQHTDFLEVSIVFGLILGACIFKKSKKLNIINILSILLIWIIVFSYSAYSESKKEYGIFQKVSELYLRRKGQVRLNCKDIIDGKLFNISAPWINLPRLSGKNPLEVQYSVNRGENHYLTVSNNSSIPLKVKDTDLNCMKLDEIVIVNIACSRVNTVTKSDLLRGVRPFCLLIKKNR